MPKPTVKDRDHFATAPVSVVSLAAARRRADDLWHGAVAPHTPWPSRTAHIEALHELCYQLVAEIAERDRVLKSLTRNATAMHDMLVRPEIHDVLLAGMVKHPDLAELPDLIGEFVTFVGTHAAALRGVMIQTDGTAENAARGRKATVAIETRKAA